MSKPQQIEVTSHVARDFLQNAAVFNTMPKIVWEYVSNSLDNAKDDTLVVVVVEITSHEIVVADNGVGMSREDLSNFFKMHGENVQRRKGKRVRGRFGTGKCAAFGLANCLEIDTVQAGLRNVVRLSRGDIEDARNGMPFPVRDIVVDEPTENDDGTVVRITDLNIRRPDVDKVISYVERHLSRYRHRALVSVNGHECKFKELLAVKEFERYPPPEVASHIGSIPLRIKVSPTPLDDETKGIDILSYGIWHETTLAGIEKRERSQYLFGEIDVPLLEDGDWPIPAFDNTRNNMLNRQNPVVIVLLGWLSDELEKVRLHLVEQERMRRETEAAKQLADEARRISDIINDDFERQELELELTHKVTKRSGGRSVNEILDEHGDLWPGQGDEPTPWEQAGASHGNGKRGDLGGEGDLPRPGPMFRDGNEPGAKKSITSGTRKRRHGVFSIDFEYATSESPRSHYDTAAKTIFINLEHPQMASAFEAGGRRVDSRQFREICYEVAMVEYALALPHEKAEKEPFYDASDALFDVRETLNRITRRFVEALDSK